MCKRCTKANVGKLVCRQAGLPADATICNKHNILMEYIYLKVPVTVQPALSPGAPCCACLSTGRDAAGLLNGAELLHSVQLQSLVHYAHATAVACEQ